jgi:hypothetical protein
MDASDVAPNAADAPAPSKKSWTKRWVLVPKPAVPDVRTAIRTALRLQPPNSLFRPPPKLFNPFACFRHALARLALGPEVI